MNEIIMGLRCLAANNMFGLSGIMDKHGNILGFIFLVFGVIMLAFSGKVKKMGSFYLEMENHDPVIKDNGFELATANVGERRSTEIGGKTFSEVQLLFEHEGKTYELWTPDLGMEGFVNIEYNPAQPSEFYITDKVEGEDVPDKDEDGAEIESTKRVNNAFYVMLVFGIVLLGMGCGILYDFYMLK